MICNGIENNSSENFESFTSNYNPRDSDSYDIAVFAKIVLKIKGIERTVIICGGCESYGTRKIGEYILNNWKNKMSENKEDKELSRGSNQNTVYSNPQFISVYKIPHEESGEKISLIHHYSR